MTAACPRCSTADVEVPLADGAGALGEAVCPGCGGRVLDEAAVQRVIIEEHGIARETLRELAGHFGRPLLRCPGCGQRMHPICLRQVPLDLCTGCGAVWLDAGELWRLTEGRWAEVARPAPPAPATVAAPAHPVAAPAPSWCAVILDDADVDAERVVAAFARARFRTAQDARTAALRGHGVLADRVPEEDARALQAGLVAEGLVAQVLDAAHVELPGVVRTKQLAFDTAGIAVADALGRAITLPWRWLRVLGVGLVKVAETETQLVGPQSGDATPYGGHGMSSLPAPNRVRTAIVERDDVLIDLLLDDEQGRRGRFRVTRSGIVVRQRAGVTRDATFRALVAELVARSPPATAMAHGTGALRDPGHGWQRFRALRDFEQATRWALARTYRSAT